MNIADFFSPTYYGQQPFQLFGPVHLTALLLVVAANLALLRLRNAPEPVRSRARWMLALITWVNEFGLHAWRAAVGQWTFQTMLPLHLCNMLVWVGGYALVTKNRRAYEFCYFMGIAGAIQALFTPDVGIYAFPHYYFFQTYLGHGLLVTTPIYLTVVEGMRPTWASLGRVFLWMNVILVLVFFINQAIGSNYMFVAYKPNIASALDLLPAWPFYIFYMELIGVVCCLLLYLPFMFRDGKRQRFLS